MSQPAPKCQDCGHPEPKHSRGRRGGCAARMTVRTAAARVGIVTQLRDCGCAVYRAPDGTTAPTIAELIEQDKARLAAARVSRETSPAASAGNGDGIGFSDHM